MSRITGLARELLMASTFGANAMTDAFNVAFRIPNLFRRFFGEGAFSQAFVPVLAASKAQHGELETRFVIDRVATVLTWALMVISVIGVAAAPVMVWAMASGLKQDPRGFELAVVMTRWMFPYIAFMSLVALAAGVLNTWKRFAVPAATPVLLNLCMIGAAWLGAPWFEQLGLEPIYALAGGVLAGGVLQLGVQLLALKRMGLAPRIGLGWQQLRTAWSDPATKNILRLMGPALLGVSVAHISMLINTQIASHLAAGSVSWITYADRLMEFPTAMLGVAMGVVLMPQLALARAAGDANKYSGMLDWGLRLVVLLALPCAVALLLFAKPLVAVLVITQLLNLFLVPMFAHAALTLSIGIGAMINATWLLVGLLRRGSYTPEPGWGVFFLQVIAACALLAIFLIWANGAFQWTELRAESWKRIGLLALILAGSGAIYFVAIIASGLNLKQFLKR